MLRRRRRQQKVEQVGRNVIVSQPFSSARTGLPEAFGRTDRRGLPPEQAFDLAFPVDHAKNENILPFNAIDDDVFADGETAHPNAEVSVA